MNLLNKTIWRRNWFAFAAILSTLVVTGVIFFSYYQSQAKASFDNFPTQEFQPEDYSEFKQSLSSPEVDYTNKQSEVEVTTPEIDLVQPTLNGEYVGVKSSFLNSNIQFPESRLSISNDTSFTYTGSGFDLGILNNPALAVNNQYPTVNAVMFGSFISDSEQTMQITINKIETEFFLNGTVVESDVRSNLEKSLEIAGLIIPNPTSTLPIYTQASLETINNTININNNTDAVYIFNFFGRKNI
ncbi:MAG: hypothetical protein AAGF07_00260 [Patescibacteria group bacterium]